MSWVERAADRSPIVQKSRTRGIQQARGIVDAAQRLIQVKGSGFTTQELVKEAGVALQTFYRYFAGKDQLLLAVIEDIIGESCIQYEEQAQALSDPLDRLHHYINVVLHSIGNPDPSAAGPAFITTEHWRLQRLYPEELAEAVKPYSDLILQEIRAAAEAGRLKPHDAEYDAWLINQLVMAVFHHYAFAPTSESGEEIAERVWVFCLSALGGDPESEARSKAKRRGKSERIG